MKTSQNKLVLTLAGVILLAMGLVGGYLIPRDAATPAATSGSATVQTLASQVSATEHNEQDVSFTQDMVPHHTQALQMAELAPTRASRTEVKQLAADIAAAQLPEIDRMNGWLTSWGSTTSSGSITSMPGMDHGSSTSTSGSMDMGSGMMSEADMSSLASKSGADFDKTFLTMMIQHHSGAIAMANTEVSKGKYAGAVALATSIQLTQQAEINQMKALL